jgi:glycosyltransferase involved in cell wall biosynthesis
MHVALICNEFPPRPHGGIGTFTGTFANSLISLGHRVTVFELDTDSREREDTGIRIISVKDGWSRGLSWYFRRRSLHRVVADTIRAEHVDLVEVPDFLGLLPFEIRDCPVVVRLHLSETAIARHMGSRNPISNRIFERRQLKVHGNWIGVSNHALAMTLEAFPGIKPRRSKVIYYPIIAEPAESPVLPRLPEEFLLFAGHVNRRKGALRVAESCCAVLDAHPQLHLVYVGAIWNDHDVSMEKRIRDILGEQRSRRCAFLGNIPRAQVLACMKRARALVFPSQLETFGLVVAEAMMQGCPVIVHAIPPFTEFVTHERTGLLVSVDSVAAWSEMIERALSDDALISAMSLRASAFVQQELSIQKHAVQSLDFYAQCMANRDAK